MAPPVMPTPQYKSPKLVMIALSNISVTKASYPWYNTLLLAWLSGAYVCFGAMLAISIAGGMSPGISTVLKMPSLQKLMFGCLFPVALMLIIVTGSELMTGNMMTMPLGVITKKITMKDLAKNWFLVYFGNWFGCAMTAYFLGYLTVFYNHEPYVTYLMGFIQTKVVTLGWGEVFLRAIGCNWLVCLAVFLAIASEDISSRLQASFWPIMCFAAIGFEHCIANMFVVTLAFMIRAGYTHPDDFPAIKDYGYGDFIGRNLIPATLGNLLGGLLFVGVFQYIAYGIEHTDPRLKTAEDKAEKRKLFSKLSRLPVTNPAAGATDSASNVVLAPVVPSDSGLTTPNDNKSPVDAGNVANIPISAHQQQYQPFTAPPSGPVIAPQHLPTIATLPAYGGGAAPAPPVGAGGFGAPYQAGGQHGPSW